ncbi:MAG: RHS repeat-associated core domain-containing protein [Polyangiales bacterium]
MSRSFKRFHPRLVHTSALALMAGAACTASGTLPGEATATVESSLNQCFVTYGTCLCGGVKYCDVNSDGCAETPACVDAGSTGNTGPGGGDAGGSDAGPSGPPTPPPIASCPSPNSDTFQFPADLTSPASSTTVAPNPNATGTVGATPGSFAVSNDGAATYTIPLEVPPGRVGMEPHLAISFSSDAGVGLAGKGFDLSGFTSMVHRCESTIAQDGFARAVRYDARDKFCLDGVRLVPVTTSTTTSVTGGAVTTTEYRAFPDTFVKVLAQTNGTPTAAGPDSFLVYDKSGNVSAYNQLTMALDGSVKASWLRTSTADRRGNGISYQFGVTTDSVGNTMEYWPAQVNYSTSPNLGNAADRSVVFAYYPNSYGQPFLVHHGMEGGAIRLQSHYLQSVTMNAPTGLVHTYTFSYNASLGTGWPLLQYIQDCNASNICKNGSTFTWNDHIEPNAAQILGVPSHATLSNVIDPSNSNGTQVGTYLTADATGDGLDDLVSLTLATSPPSYVVTVYANQGGDFGAPTAPLTIPLTTLPGQGFSWALQPMDYDQDGRMDIILNSSMPGQPWPTLKYLHSICPGTTVTSHCANATYELLDTGIPVGQQPLGTWGQATKLADMNGDGVADLVQCNDPAAHMSSGLGSYPMSGNPTWEVFLWGGGTGTSPGWQPTAVQLGPSIPCVSWPGNLLIADTDGDGRVEALMPSPSPSQTTSGDVPGWTYQSVQFSGAMAGGAATVEALMTQLEVQDSSALPPLFIDVNGDGHPDALFPYGWGNGVTWQTGFTLWPDFRATPASASDASQSDGDHYSPDGSSSPSTNDNLFVHLGNGGTTRYDVTRTPVLANDNAGIIDWSWGDWGTQFFQFAVPLDFNGDGQMDLLIPVPGSCDAGATGRACWDVYIMPHGGLGSPYAQVQHTYRYLDGTDHLAQAGGGVAWFNNAFLPRIVDVDGDGRQDIVWFAKNSPGNPAGVASLYILKYDTPQDQLVSITDGNYIGDSQTVTPKTIALSYGSLVDGTVHLSLANSTPATSDPMVDVFYDPNSGDARSNPALGCHYPEKCVVGNRQVVSQYTAADGQGGARTYAMRYRDGRSDELGRGWLGFGEVVTLDVTNENQGHHGHAEFFDNDTRETIAGATDVYPFAHRVSSTIDWDPGPTPLAQVEVTTTSNIPAVSPDDTGKSYFTYAQSSTTSRYEGTFTSPQFSYCGNVPTMSGLLSLTWECYPRGEFSFAESGIFSAGFPLGATTRSVTGMDTFGNVTTATTTTTNADLTTTTTNTFYNDPTTWYIGRTSASTACSSTSTHSQQCKGLTVTAFTAEFEPASVVLGDPSDPTTQLTTNLTYDAFGHVTEAVAVDFYGNQRSACTSYEATEVFPYAGADSLSHPHRMKFDLGLGVLKDSVDPNGLVTQYAYDGFGRRVADLQPDGVETITTLAKEKVGGPFGTYWYTTASTVTVAAATSATVGAPTRTIVDGGGRTTHAQHAGPLVSTCGVSGCTSAPVFAEDAYYDTLGRVSEKSLPHLLSDPASAIQYVTYQYDEADRVVSEMSPWNTTTTSYSHNVMSTIDSVGALKSVVVDGIGRVSSVTDANAGVMRYGYGPFGALWTIVNQTTTLNGAPDNTSKSVTRDVLGRVIASSDPDHGVTSSINYDGFGDVTSLTDANGRKIAMQYDSLGRLVVRTDPDGTTLWQYDWGAVASPGLNQPQHALGKLNNVTSPGGAKIDMVFDSLTRPLETMLTVGGELFTATVAYDPTSGLPTATTYPLPFPAPTGVSPLVVVNDYDSYGNLVGLHDQNLGTTYWTLTPLDGHGQFAAETLQNKMVRTTTYDPTTHQVSRLQAGLSQGSGQLQDLSYTYDPRFNLKSRSDATQVVGGQALEEHFYYDPLDRLTCSYVDHSATVSSSPTCSWSVSYAGNGNIAQKSDVGSYTYDPNHPHAVRTAGSTFQYQYDQVGNQLTRPDSTIKYTAFDLPASYTRKSDSVVVSLQYDGAQNRLRKSDNVTQTTYFGSLYERMRSVTAPSATTDLHTFIVPTGSTKLEIVRQSGKPDTSRYVFSDVLGSTDVVTSTTGTILEQRSYDAFGQRRNHAGWTAGTITSSVDNIYGFTGQEDEAGLPLVNMKGRIYDPRLGRFLQADPIMGSPFDSQRYNAYSYVLNNPLKFTDPTGFDEQNLQINGGDTGSRGMDVTGTVSATKPDVSPVGTEAGPAAAPAATTETRLTIAAGEGGRTVRGERNYLAELPKDAGVGAVADDGVHSFRDLIREEYGSANYSAEEVTTAGCREGQLRPVKDGRCSTYYELESAHSEVSVRSKATMVKSGAKKAGKAAVALGSEGKGAGGKAAIKGAEELAEEEWDTIETTEPIFHLDYAGAGPAAHKLTEAEKAAILAAPPAPTISRLGAMILFPSRPLPGVWSQEPVESRPGVGGTWYRAGSGDTWVHREEVEAEPSFWDSVGF